MSPRRILAVVLPELLCEVARDHLAPLGASREFPPLAVVLESEAENQTLIAANDVARKLGVRAGQSVIEASTLVFKLQVKYVSRKQIMAALARVAEVALGYGATVSIEESDIYGTEEALPDTVWVDVSGTAHLKGGEQALAEDLESQVRALGHVVRVAIADGKWQARAFALWCEPLRVQRALIVDAKSRFALMKGLSILALPLSAAQRKWLAKLGVLTIGELEALPTKPTLARLGATADKVFALCRGEDEAPLTPYQLPRTLTEETTWDEPVEGEQPLLFVLRGLAARVSARLEGRGEAAQSLRLTFLHDPSIAKLRNASVEFKCDFELAAPLWREQALLKVLSSKLERLKLNAPSLGLRLEVPRITQAVGRQLDLSRLLQGTAAAHTLEALPVLFAELNAEVGPQQVGLLKVRDAHRPEQRSVFVLARSEVGNGGAAVGRVRGGSSEMRVTTAKALRKSRPGLNPLKVPPTSLSYARVPTRLLAEPLRVMVPLRVGAVLSVGCRLYSIERLEFESRLEAVEWWAHPVGRDYLRLWLKGPECGLSALAYVERETGRRFLQAFFD